MTSVRQATSSASLTTRAFRATLRLLPTTFPASDARELVHIYEALDTEARHTRGRHGGAVTFARELPGLAHLVAREHMAAWRARRVRRRQLRRIASYQRPYSEDTSMIESLLQDVRYAARVSRRRSMKFAGDEAYTDGGCVGA